MSGKGKERFQRGKFSSRPNYGGSARKENRPSKQSVSDWNYCIGSSRQTSEYDAITEQLMNHIKENFEYGNDIAACQNCFNRATQMRLEQNFYF